MKLILKWLLHAIALLAITQVYSDVVIDNYSTALLAALVIGLFNIFLRPLLILLTLPISILSLGLFLFVINALLFWAASHVMTGFIVQGFAAALLGSLIYSALGLVIDSALNRLFTKS